MLKKLKVSGDVQEACENSVDQNFFNRLLYPFLDKRNLKCVGCEPLHWEGQRDKKNRGIRMIRHGSGVPPPDRCRSHRHLT